MNYGSSLREQEENFDNLCCESSQPSVGISRVWLTRFEQRRNEDESSSVHRETVAFTVRVKPSLLESSSGGSGNSSSNPMSIHPRTKSNYRKGKNPSRRQNLDCDSWMTYVKKILLKTLIFKNVYFDTMIDVTVKKREQN